jgi:hypothetical protein
MTLIEIAKELAENYTEAGVMELLIAYYTQQTEETQKLTANNIRYKS